MNFKLILSIALFGLFFNCFGRTNSTWDKWSWLTGEWAGEGSGQPGQGGRYFSFKTDLDNNILVRNSHSEYTATGNSPMTVHNDLMIVYPCNPGESFKAIYSDNEGHTINYLVAVNENSIILTGEKRPDNPVFRLTYMLLDKETVNTKFEMSQDNVKFYTYIEDKSKKTK